MGDAARTSERTSGVIFTFVDDLLNSLGDVRERISRGQERRRRARESASQRRYSALVEQYDRAIAIEAYPQLKLAGEGSPSAPAHLLRDTLLGLKGADEDLRFRDVP